MIGKQSRAALFRRVFFSLFLAGVIFFIPLGAEEPSAPESYRSLNRDGTFHNLQGVDVNPSIGRFRLFLKFMFGKDDKQEPLDTLPILRRSREDYSQRLNPATRITWLGHATFLVESGGYRILTDPHLGERASPVSWAGPKRYTPPPITVAELPPIDLVIISHNHYDHMDHKTILQLKDKTNRFLVPLGVGRRLTRWGVEPEKIEELDWWDEFQLDSDSRLIFTPAQHFSARTPFDNNKTLWGSWVIITAKKRIYFSGDTGMFDVFGEIGRRFGPFDYTLMHIGAYSDIWPKTHMTPEEAVAAHRLLKGDILIPMHWGTFRMAFHPWQEPAERLVREAKRVNIEFVTPLPGQMIRKPESLPRDYWWRNYR